MITKEEMKKAIIKSIQYHLGELCNDVSISVWERLKLTEISDEEDAVLTDMFDSIYDEVFEPFYKSFEKISKTKPDKDKKIIPTKVKAIIGKWLTREHPLTIHTFIMLPSEVIRRDIEKYKNCGKKTIEGVLLFHKELQKL